MGLGVAAAGEVRGRSSVGREGAGGPEERDPFLGVGPGDVVDVVVVLAASWRSPEEIQRHTRGCRRPGVGKTLLGVGPGVVDGVVDVRADHPGAMLAHSEYKLGSLC